MKEENYHHGSGVNVNFTGARVVLLQKNQCNAFFWCSVFCPFLPGSACSIINNQHNQQSDNEDHNHNSSCVGMSNEVSFKFMIK